MIKDSGERREFESGAVRDIQEGKGRFDLCPLTEMGQEMDDAILTCIGSYIDDGDSEYLSRALYHFIITLYCEKYSSVTSMYADAYLEVGIHYEEGATKYGEHNWQKGIPLHCYIDSAVRHYLKFLRGDTDERHDRAFMWNILGALWTIDHKPELIDIGGKNGNDAA